MGQPERDDDAEDQDIKEQSTDKRIQSLDAEAERMATDMFVTKYLTAVVVPAEGVTAKQCSDEIFKSNPGGIVWDTVTEEKGCVRIRAGLVPSLDSETFRAVLCRMDLVGSA